MTIFPRRMFRWAAVYGVIVLLPLYFTPLPQVGAELFLGFVGLALVFQGVFWTIGGDPVKFRALMPLAVLEKLVFGVPALSLYAQGYPVRRQSRCSRGSICCWGWGSFWLGAERP